MNERRHTHRSGRPAAARRGRPIPRREGRAGSRRLHASAAARVFLLTLLLLSLLPVTAAASDTSRWHDATGERPAGAVPDGSAVTPVISDERIRVADTVVNRRAGDAPRGDAPRVDAAEETVDRLLVRRARGVGLAEASAGASDRASVPVQAGERAAGGYELLEFDEPVTRAEAEELARQLVDAGVADVAEPDYRVGITAVNDPGYDWQWSFHGEPEIWQGLAPTYGIDVERAWDVTTGSDDIVVAVLDTGVREHVDLASRLVPGYDFILDTPGGIDPGDWRGEGDCDAPNDDASTSSWHGLHVAGTIGAVTNNNVGVAGVDREARIQSVRVLGPCGGSTSDVITGIYWAAGADDGHLPPGVPVNTTPADVLNLSLGGPGVCGTSLQQAINYAVGQGSVVVVAAGNSDTDASGFVPANCQNVVTVAATSPIGDKADYSNFGTGVDIAAPGGDHFFSAPATGDGMILSLSNAGTTVPGSDSYAWMQGTSMAAPHVSGVVSLLLSLDDTLDHDDVLEILQATAQPFPPSPFPDYQCSASPSAQYHCGAGIVDAGAATLVAGGLTAPTVTATPGQRSATVNWSEVTPLAGLDRYEVFRSTSSGCSTSNTPVHSGSDTSRTFTSLSAATTYRFCVYAVDTNGVWSPRSNVASVRPIPATPTGLQATAGPGQVSVSWNSATGATGYEVYRRTSPCTESSKGSKRFDGSGTSFTDKSVTAGTTYHYCVLAKNGSGSSTLSSAVSAKPTALPPPSWKSDARLRFDLASNGVKLSWPAPNGTVGHYQVQRDGTTVGTTTNRSLTVGGLKDGQRHRLRVRAVNSGGESPWLNLDITPSSGFRDVGSTNNFRQDIRWLATGEVTRGCNPPTNDRFCPNDVVTREQMAAFMVRALGLTETSSRGNFTDVPASNGFRTDINRLATAGITAGCNPPKNDRFCPKDPVSREQMAAFMGRALQLKATSSKGSFTDVPSSNTFQQDINRFATAGITAGCNPPKNDRFCPKDPVTRQQMAAFMRRALAG